MCGAYKMQVTTACAEYRKKGGRKYTGKVCGCKGTGNKRRYSFCYADGDKENNMPANRIKKGAC